MGLFFSRYAATFLTPLTSISSSPSSDGTPWLVADIGGTNARFGWVDGPGRAVEHVTTIRVADHAGPAQAIAAYLAQLRQHGGRRWPAPRKAAFAVATAVRGDEIAFTNSTWRFSRQALASELGLDALLVLNDFEALALSLPGLASSQHKAIGATRGAAAGGGTLAVIGPGTGLGVGGVIETARGWVAMAGEGGHATLAAADDEEARVIAEVRREHAHVSAERVLSGIGLPSLHAAVARVHGHAAPTSSAEQIVDGATASNDPACRQTIEMFCALLGGFAGNVALTLGARALFIGGGIVPRLGDMFFTSRFRERFEAKGRFRAYLEAVPTALITDTLAALAGAAAALEQHGR